jgi:uncharacterized membrane protein
MAMKKPLVLSLTPALMAFLLVVWLAFAEGSYDLARWTVDGGGGKSSGGLYTIVGGIGQPDAGMLSGGDYTLGGGFWGGGAVAAAHLVYLPTVLKSYP